MTHGIPPIPSENDPVYVWYDKKHESINMKVTLSIAMQQQEYRYQYASQSKHGVQFLWEFMSLLTLGNQYEIFFFSVKFIQESSRF